MHDSYTNTHKSEHHKTSLSLKRSFTSIAEKPKYLEAWFARAWLLSAMAQEGVSGLSGADAIGWEEFATAFPDSRAWFPRLAARRSEHWTLKEYFDNLGYTGKPEFFSAMACLLLGKGMHVNPDWLLHRQQDLEDFSQEYSNHHGLDMVPARVVRAVHKGLKASDP